MLSELNDSIWDLRFGGNDVGGAVDSVRVSTAGNVVGHAVESVLTTRTVVVRAVDVIRPRDVGHEDRAGNGPVS